MTRSGGADAAIVRHCLHPRCVQSTPTVIKMKTREQAMSGTDKSSTTRRDLLQTAAVAGAATALFGGLAASPGALAAAARSEKPLKAAFSNAGLQATWCAQGKQAAEWWGKLFNVEVTW